MSAVHATLVVAGEREAIQSREYAERTFKLDCHVAALLATTTWGRHAAVPDSLGAALPATTCSDSSQDRMGRWSARNDEVKEPRPDLVLMR